jgi:hypothetical protein
VGGFRGRSGAATDQQWAAHGEGRCNEASRGGWRVAIAGGPAKVGGEGRGGDEAKKTTRRKMI